jgi:hypothetical protein|tara:strand:- start:321 stop:1010 length:690 start_codon:yes stop_codon:yes gene_type:complete
MKIYSLTCTRGELSPTTTKLLEFFKSCDIESKLLIGEHSIFRAYEKGIEDVNADPEDIIILCHDDIEVLTRPEVFTQLLKEKLSQSDTGFVGAAGTRHFAKSGVWWDMEQWKAGSHSGYVFHGKDISTMDATFFGQLGEVVVMDGVFLAATKRTLDSIQLTQPKKFVGRWDFYDIFYTFQTFLKGKKNYTIPIQLRHESIGELAGRDSWHRNREAFLKQYGKHLPAKIV